MVNTIVKSGEEELKQLETLILDRSKRIKTDFFEIGEACRTIVRKELYKLTHKSLEDYCRDRLPFSRQYCYEIMKAAEMKEELTESFDCIPEIPAQYKALMPLQPEERQKVWSIVLQGNPKGNASARQIKAAIQTVAPRATKQKATNNTTHNTINVMAQEVIDTPEQLDTTRYIEVPQNRDEALKMLVSRDIKIKTQQNQIQHLQDLIASLNDTIALQQRYTLRPQIPLDSKFFELPPDDRAFTEENREKKIQELEAMKDLPRWAATELEWTHYIHREGIQLEAEVQFLREQDALARIAAQQVQYREIEIQGLKEQLQALMPESLD